MREKRGIQKIESSNSRRKLLVREATGASVGLLWSGLIVVFVLVFAVVHTQSGQLRSRCCSLVGLRRH